MAFKMKGSPAKRGEIQGTDGHASALKQTMHPTDLPMGGGGGFVPTIDFRAGPSFANAIRSMLGYKSLATKFPAATAVVESAVIAKTGADVINSTIESATEKSQSKNSSKLSEASSSESSRNKIQNENVAKEFVDRGLNQKEMYTKRDKYYSDFREANPDVKGHPYNHLTDKDGPHYNADFSLLQNKIYKTHEAGILRGGGGEAHLADTSGANPTFKHK
jgi:hypothetical protein